MDIDNHKSKNELLAEIQKLRQIVEQSAPGANNLIQQCDDLTLINNLSSAVIQQKPLVNILALLSRSVGNIFNSNGIAVYLLGQDGNFLEMQPNTLPSKISDMVEKLLAIKIPPVKIKQSPDSLYFRTIASGQPIVISDEKNIAKLITEFTDNKILQKYIPKIQEVLGIKHVVIFPLTLGNSCLGAMDISRKNAFSDIEIRRLQNIIVQVTEAILFHRSILEKEALLSELQNSYSKIKALSGLIPICSHCKKIRDDSGYWNQVEKYISEHSDAVFSHGICPDCMRELYPEFVEEINSQNLKK